MARATLIASLTQPPSTDGRELRDLPEGVDVLEVRADLTGELDPDWLRGLFPGEILYTLRSRHEGGRYEGSQHRRHQLLAAAAQRYDIVDLEAERDLDDTVLDAIPADRRVLSWHGSASGLLELKARFERVAVAGARWFKLVPSTRQEGEETAVLALLHALERRDVICFAAGETGTWTRLIAPRLGAAVVYGSVGDDPAGPGQLRIRDLCLDYGLPEMRPVQGVFGILGNPVLHSLSPRLHNNAYRSLGMPFLYLPFHVESFGDFWLDFVEAGTLSVLGMPLLGLSVTAPFKASALAVAGATSPRAEWIGGANTLVCREGVWEATSTDPEGVVEPLRLRGIDVKDQAVAVVGAGGAGCAAAVALAAAGARVEMFNRGLGRREEAHRRLHVPCHALEDLAPGRYRLLVHATAVGRRGEMPFSVDSLGPGHTVVDLVYGTEPTALIRATRERGAVGIDGREVLLQQAVFQFRIMTGGELPLDESRALLGLEGP